MPSLSEIYAFCTSKVTENSLEKDFFKTIINVINTLTRRELIQLQIHSTTYKNVYNELIGMTGLTLEDVFKTGMSSTRRRGSVNLEASTVSSKEIIIDMLIKFDAVFNEYFFGSKCKYNKLSLVDFKHDSVYAYNHLYNEDYSFPKVVLTKHYKIILEIIGLAGAFISGSEGTFNNAASTKAGFVFGCLALALGFFALLVMIRSPDRIAQHMEKANEHLAVFMRLVNYRLDGIAIIEVFKKRIKDDKRLIGYISSQMRGGGKLAAILRYENFTSDHFYLPVILRGTASQGLPENSHFDLEQSILLDELVTNPPRLPQDWRPIIPLHRVSSIPDDDLPVVERRRAATHSDGTQTTRPYYNINHTIQWND